MLLLLFLAQYLLLSRAADLFERGNDLYGRGELAEAGESNSPLGS